MGRLLFSILFGSLVAVGFPTVGYAAQDESILVDELHGVVAAWFPIQVKSQSIAFNTEGREFLKFFGITLTQETLVEHKNERSLFKVTQKNWLGEKSEFHELRWQEGAYFVVATVLNSSPEALKALKALPRNPWAGRKPASADAQAEAGICPHCESSKLMKPLDDLVHAGREWVAVDCQAEKVDNKVTGAKIISSVGSCLRGISLTVIDLAKLLYALAAHQLKTYSDPQYSIAFTRIIWEAARNPTAFLQNLYSMILTAAKGQWEKLKTCSVDYQVGFTCQLLTDVLVPAGLLVKAFKGSAFGVKKTVDIVREAVSTRAKTSAAAVRPVARSTPSSETTLSVRPQGNDVEYVVSSGGKEAARASGDQVRRHVEDASPPREAVLISELEEVQNIASDIGPGVRQIQIQGARRLEIEKLYKKILDEAPQKHVVSPANEKALNELANMIAEELGKQGIKAKPLRANPSPRKASAPDLSSAIRDTEAALARVDAKLKSSAPDSAELHRLKVEQRKLRTQLGALRDDLRNIELNRLSDTVEIDLTSTPELRRVAERLNVQRIVVPIREIQDRVLSAGRFSENGTVSLGMNSVLNPEGMIDAIALHEFHHASTFVKRQRDANYPFFGEVFARDGQTVNTIESYSRSFDMDEIPAYSRSLAYAERGMENPTTIAQRPGVPRASTQRVTPTRQVRVRAEQLKQMAQSGLENIELARQRLAGGMQAIRVIPTDGGRRVVIIPLYRNGVPVGDMKVYPPALRAGTGRPVVEVISEYLDEMEAATRSHLAGAEMRLQMSESVLGERIRTLTERSRNARARGGSGRTNQPQ